MKEASETTVLVVDDEEPIRVLLNRFLSQEDYRVVTANDVEQALAMLSEQTIDLILLDLHMPGPYDGEELLFLLRDRGDEIPIIVVSGWVDDEATINRPDCVYAVLKKPINHQQLMATVQSALA